MKYTNYSNSRFNSSKHLASLIEGYSDLIEDYLAMGWDGYMVSVMFHQLAGSRNAIIAQMGQETDRVYRHLCKRMVRKVGSPGWAGYLPIGIFLPDLPVPKSKGKKSTIEDVSINDGLHLGGIILANRWGRITKSLDDHFKEHKDNYVRGKIRNIDVQDITEPRGAVGYEMKSIKRRSFSPDDVLVFNWGNSSPKPSLFSEAVRQEMNLDHGTWAKHERRRRSMSRKEQDAIADAHAASIGKKAQA
jgi:hypothetical protein